MYDATRTDKLPDGTKIDLDTYDWGDTTLSKREKLFCVWYTYPNLPPDEIHNATLAALRAGYKTQTAYRAKWMILTRDDVKSVVDRMQEYVDTEKLEDAYKRATNMLLERPFYNVKDFFETVEYTNDDGNTFTRTQVKNLDNIPADKAMLIDSVDINQTGIATFKLPQREQALKNLIAYREKKVGKDDGNSINIETTIGLIKDNMAAAKTVITINQNCLENQQDYVENEQNQPDFD